MAVLLTGLGLFVIALAFHIAIWRWRRPQRTGQTLMVIFVAAIVAGAGCAALVAAAVPALRLFLPDDMFSWLHALLLALALAAAYVMTYPALEVESPTLVIVEAIAQRGPAGMPVHELQQCLDDRVLVDPRLQDMLDERLAVLEDGRYRPTAKGIALARMFAAWRRVIRADIGG